MFTFFKANLSSLSNLIETLLILDTWSETNVADGNDTTVYNRLEGIPLSCVLSES